GRDHRRRRPLAAGLAHHAAVDPLGRRRAADPADRQHPRHRVRADLPDVERAQPLGRRRVRHLRLLHRHPAGCLLLRDRGRSGQGHRRPRPDLRDQLAREATQAAGDLLMASLTDQRFNTRAGRVFDGVNAVVLVAIGLLALLPFLYVLAGSFATELEITTRPFFLWPTEITTASYESILSSRVFVRAFVTTVVVTGVGTVIQLALTALMAYPLSKIDLP